MPKVASPHGTVEVARDALGYPRIRVPDVAAGAWGRGYLHATDRLVQTHLSIFVARGRMMEILGDVPAARLLDRATRHLQFTRGLSHHERQLGPQSRQLIEAYVQGFEAGRRTRSWPLPLRALGIRPRPLQTGDVLCLYRLAGYLGLTSLQHTAEALIAELIIRGATDAGLELLMGDARAGLDASDLENVRVGESQAYMTLPLQQGSNAFAVGGARSASGSALLMSEWHLEVGRFPPLVYPIHIEYPAGFVQGITMPGLPFVSSGRTDKIAWAYTYGHADHVDFFVERCKGARIQTKGGWLPLKRRVERVKVRFGTEETWEYWDAPHGTIHGDADVDGDHLCLRWSGLHDVLAGDMDAATAVPESKSAAEVIDAHRRLRTHSFGMVIADTQGVVAQMQTGQLDDRPDGWTGGYPRRGWDLADRDIPVLPEDQRPVTLGRDWVVQANQAAHCPDGRAWTTLPEPAYRAETIGRHLEGEGRTLHHLVAASYDTHDGCAALLLEAWATHLPTEAAGLLQWGASQADDRATNLPLFWALHHEASKGLVARHLGADVAEEIAETLQVLGAYQPQIDPVLAGQVPHLLDARGLERLLGEAWPKAIERAKTIEMPVRRPFRNMIFQGWLPEGLGFDSPVVEFPGSPTSPFQSRTVSFRGFEMVVGPAFHYCTDMGERGGWYHVPGGASEDRWGPGYGRGVEDWLVGKFHPIGDPSGAPPDRVPS